MSWKYCLTMTLEDQCLSTGLVKGWILIDSSLQSGFAKKRLVPVFFWCIYSVPLHNRMLIFTIKFIDVSYCIICKLFVYSKFKILLFYEQGWPQQCTKCINYLSNDFCLPMGKQTSCVKYVEVNYFVLAGGRFLSLAVELVNSNKYLIDKQRSGGWFCCQITEAEAAHKQRMLRLTICRNVVVSKW